VGEEEPPVPGGYLRPAGDQPAPAGYLVAAAGHLGRRPVELVFDAARVVAIVVVGATADAPTLSTALATLGMRRKWPQLEAVEVWVGERHGVRAAAGLLGASDRTASRSREAGR
jgi:hypothetical protein